MEKTANFNLLKPGYEDGADIASLDANMDVIDAELKNLQDNKSPLASPALTGTPTAPTAAADTSTTQLATTAFVTGQASTTPPVMDGTPTTGISKKFARADHTHPTDISLVSLDVLHGLGLGTNTPAAITDPLDLTLPNGIYYLGTTNCTNLPPNWSGGIVEILSANSNNYRKVVAHPIYSNQSSLVSAVSWSNVCTHNVGMGGDYSMWLGWKSSIIDETGTWTPYLIFSTNTGSIVYSDQNGTYTKHGNVITCQMFLGISSISGCSGLVFIGGLPEKMYTSRPETQISIQYYYSLPNKMTPGLFASKYTETAVILREPNNNDFHNLDETYLHAGSLLGATFTYLAQK